MKLFSLRLTTLKSKLYAIVFASFVVRVVAFFALPNTASKLAPDEETYANISGWAADGQLTSKDPYYGGLYFRTRALTLPASVLVRFGFSPIDSVRAITSIYGIASLALIVFLLLKTSNKNLRLQEEFAKNEKLILVSTTLFAFLPSHFGWSILGLREAPIEFWIILTFTLIYLSTQIYNRSSIVNAFGLVTSITLVFWVRQQVGFLLVVVLFLFFLTQIKQRVAKLYLPVVLIGLFAGYFSTTTALIESTEVFEARLVVINSTSSPTAINLNEFDPSTFCKTDGEIVVVQGAKFLCVKITDKRSVIGLKNPLVVLVDEVDTIPERQEGNRNRAASAIKAQACPINSDSRFDKYFCILYSAPYSTYTFLARPTLGADVTSSSSLFAATENVFWLVAFIYVIVMLFRNRRLAFFGAISPSLLFFSIYSVAAGAYEGNMGTAFRHKSLILWVVLLLIASTIVATQQRRAEQHGISGSSQE